MAKRRMFSMDIIDTDCFLEMPATSQLLYFHLSMRADDDGFISNPKRIMKLTGSSDDDMRILMSKQYIIPFSSGVCVVKHWRIHNYIQNDRYHKTMYKEELKGLEVDENGVYKALDTSCIQPVSKMDTEVRLGKVSLGKVRLEKEQDKEYKLGAENPAPSRPAVTSLPKINDNDFPIYQDQIDQFSKAYPSVNVLQEIERMRAWLMANPKNGKTNIMRFVNNWLSKQQDKVIPAQRGFPSDKPSQRTLGNDARWAQYWAEEDAKNAGQK